MKTQILNIEQNIIVNDFSSINLAMFQQPIISIYDNPMDLPGYYVARLFNANQPTPYCIRQKELHKLMALLPPQFQNIGRSNRDEKHIIATFI